MRETERYKRGFGKNVRNEKSVIFAIDVGNGENKMLGLEINMREIGKNRSVVLEENCGKLENINVFGNMRKIGKISVFADFWKKLC